MQLSLTMSVLCVNMVLVLYFDNDMYVGPLSGTKTREGTCRGHFMPLAGEGARAACCSDFRVGQEPGIRNSGRSPCSESLAA